MKIMNLLLSKNLIHIYSSFIKRKLDILSKNLMFVLDNLENSPTTISILRDNRVKFLDFLLY